MYQTPKLKFFSSRLAVVFVQYVEANGQVKNEDVVGAAPTGAAPSLQLHLSYQQFIYLLECTLY